MPNQMTRPQITYPMAAQPQSLLPAPLAQALAAILIGLVLFFLLLAASPIAFELAYRERIYPGVSVGGVDLSGLNVRDAEVRLFQQLDYPLRGRVAFQAQQLVWMATPQQLGLYLDARASAQAAYALGRNGNMFHRISIIASAWVGGASLPPLLVYDERVAQEFLRREIASQVEVPIQEASLTINGTEVVVLPGQVGRTLNILAALSALRPPLQAMSDAVIPLEIRETAPVILDASQQAEIARRILSAPLVIEAGEGTEGNPGPWSYQPA